MALSYIKAIYPDHLKLIQQVGRQTFFETFEDSNTEEDMKKYLKESFADEKIKREMTNPNSMFYLAMDKNYPAGYLRINFDGAQSEKDYPGSLEVERLYITKDQKRKGIGSELMKIAIDHAKKAGVPYMWLGVWEHNYPAQEFYKSFGFEFFGAHTFVLGNDPQTDLLMKKVL